MAGLMLPVALDDIFKFQKVQVVESVDVGNLQALLRWICDHLGTGGGPGVQDLAKENAGLREELEKLKEKQVGAGRPRGTPPNGVQS